MKHTIILTLIIILGGCDRGWDKCEVTQWDGQKVQAANCIWSIEYFNCDRARYVEPIKLNCEYEKK